MLGLLPLKKKLKWKIIDEGNAVDIKKNEVIIIDARKECSNITYS